MTICSQCNGKSACVGTEALMDPTSNTEAFEKPGQPRAAIPCTQCNGVGYY